MINKVPHPIHVKHMCIEFTHFIYEVGTLMTLAAEIWNFMGLYKHFQVV